MTNSFQTFMNTLWTDYIKITPQAQRVYDLLTQSGETVVNDHIALRTFNHPKLGIQSLAAHFLKFGYTEAGDYSFTEKKLYAKHYQHADKSYPKIFISELELEKVSPFLRETISTLADQVPARTTERDDFVFSGKHWFTSYSTYLKIAEESKYAAWVYAFGFRPNHFTVSINDLKYFKDITRLNDFLKANDFNLNRSGGEIKGSPAEWLEQSSTMAPEIKVQFADGVYSIPGCYYEFAKRYERPNGELYQGFIAKSADKIFESTNKA